MSKSQLSIPPKLNQLTDDVINNFTRIPVNIHIPFTPLAIYLTTNILQINMLIIYDDLYSKKLQMNSSRERTTEAKGHFETSTGKFITKASINAMNTVIK